jgi:hypothetical protein
VGINDVSNGDIRHQRSIDREITLLALQLGKVIMKIGLITLMVQYTIMLSTKINFKKHIPLAFSRKLRHRFYFILVKELTNVKQRPDRTHCGDTFPTLCNATLNLSSVSCASSCHDPEILLCLRPSTRTVKLTSALFQMESA